MWLINTGCYISYVTPVINRVFYTHGNKQRTLRIAQSGKRMTYGYVNSAERRQAVSQL